MANRQILYQGISYNINYEIIHPKIEETIIILHGWGSNKEVMKSAFGNYFKDHRHLYIDMPGFGKSPNETVLTTHDYAAIMIQFLEELDVQPAVVFGHSFGGKVATLLNPDLLVLLSSAGIIVPKSFKVRAKIKLFKLLKPFGISSLRRFFVSKDVEGMSEAMYKTFKNVVDEDFSAHFSHFQKKALLFWGKDDSATPLFTGEKIAALIPENSFFPLEGDHYFFLKHAAFIQEQIYKELHAKH